MITCEFLVADDLGPIGRLVEPGELMVLEKWHLPELREERKWIGEKYQDAVRKAEAARKRLSRAQLSGKRDVVREQFDLWTIEAEKYALCDNWLRQVTELVEQGKQAPMNPKATFRWMDVPQIREVVQRVVNAGDTEIIGGASFRAR